MINIVNNGKLEEVEAEALHFLELFYKETGRSPEALNERISEVLTALRETGQYEQTLEELTYGAKVAWRNNSRCIGRLFWDSLEVFDERQADSEEAIVAALLRHIAHASNNGRIRPLITVFAPETSEMSIRVWNHQLIRYAGYETTDGIIGDPSSIDFTAQCMRLGWKGRGTRFDVLPLVVQINGREPKLFTIPSELINEINITHGSIEGFGDLGLKWYSVPILSDMILDIGGIRYTAAPFNGWYMGTEIGSRNLADTDRYNALPAIADLLGLDRTTNTSLWKDRALLELNTAVIHSFKLAGVSIVDHHTAADQFMRFMKREQDNDRTVNARWSWLIPPMSPAATPIWNHSTFEEQTVRPDFVAQPRPY
ncbi:nitric oxide synthase oxygenase [Cohnella abietis]|uniref:Nitric oxide synthase oxygenase n=1 Tax=Cohnella abietis TaxID=2507935 RepID=A0A3T1D6V0_9BACL|nr:nitric oxide synthase oxygenase [Cohnella abietis]BBI33791.1 nitric oxide synthase oxygenase [Cohnella abietis]